MNTIKQMYSFGGFLLMKGVSIEERAVNLAHYIIDTKDTVRGAAKKFGVSKSTVHKDVSQ
jgi:putative DeoR family transcriptional regulator (stage III sporulation protein D)